MRQKIGITRFGGIACIAAGMLFLLQYLLLLPLPAPPPADVELLDWLLKWRFNLAMADEVLFFAALALIPSIAALHRVLAKTDRIKAMWGCGVLAVVVPIDLVLDIFLGRLVYPVYHLELSPDICRLVLSLYYGGMHLVSILLSVSIIPLSVAIRKSELGRAAAYLGLATGVLELVGAFPWLIGSVLTFAIQLLSVAWLVVIGIRLLGCSRSIRE